MDEITLTSEASDVLNVLYKEYRKRIKRGMSKLAASDFENSKVIHATLLPDRSFEAVDAACVELLRARLLTGFRADGYLYSAHLSDAGIAFSQNRISKNASTLFCRVLELVQAIRSLLPW